ncbi:MAG: hypothetical protein PHE53_06405, partial [Thermoguttaceae bacterium]|nr:hypothetical protein [Thermoguttaceae bacterium]
LPWVLCFKKVWQKSIFPENAQTFYLTMVMPTRRSTADDAVTPFPAFVGSPFLPDAGNAGRSD